MTSTVENKKIHPHMFNMWLAIASIVMMFAGLTSAYVVKQSGGMWRSYQLPQIFWVSTVVIITSSVTLALGISAFKKKETAKLKQWMLLTLVLGIVFVVLQYFGFQQLYNQPQQVILSGEQQNLSLPVQVNGNPSESFLFVIAGLHLLHIIGGIIALGIVYMKATWKKMTPPTLVAWEVIGTYWHFVDLLWIYLFIFFIANQ